MATIKLRDVGTENAPTVLAGTFADEAARLAATGFTGGESNRAFDERDVGKIFKQSDDNSYWIISAIGPVTWELLKPSGGYVGAASVDTLTNKTIDSFTNEVHADALHHYVKASEDITAGAPLRILSWEQNTDAYEVALADSALGPCFAVAYTDITTGQYGGAVVVGLVEQIDTSAFSVGDRLYLDSIGALTKVRPTTGIVQPVATVLRSQLNNGAIDVNCLHVEQNASDVQFDPTIEIDADDVQDAIKQAGMSDGSGYREFETAAHFPTVGRTGFIYLDISTLTAYTWDNALKVYTALTETQLDRTTDATQQPDGFYSYDAQAGDITEALAFPSPGKYWFRNQGPVNNVVLNPSLSFTVNGSAGNYTIKPGEMVLVEGRGDASTPTVGNWQVIRHYASPYKRTVALSPEHRIELGGRNEFGWDDLIAQVLVRGTGPASPDYENLGNGFFGYTFSHTTDQEFFCDFHFNHDVLEGSPFYPHIHFMPMTNDSGTVRWVFEILIARDHRHGSNSTFQNPNTGVDWVPLSIPVDFDVPSNSQYDHFLVECSDVQAVVSSLTVPDAVVKMRVYRDTTVLGNLAAKVHAWQADLHYRKAKFSTKNREPDFNA